MKIATVPAQITTVEDRIAGNLGVSQLLLLVTPAFMGSILYVVLPPTKHIAPYKLVLIVSLLVICSLLAIRIKRKLLLFWLLIIFRYNRRPSYYIFNKNSLAGRVKYEPSKSAPLKAQEEVKPVRHTQQSTLGTADTARVLDLMNNPDAHLYFKTDKKGILNVIFTKVKDQT